MTERPRVTFSNKVIALVTPQTFTSGYKMWTSNQNANSLISNDNFFFPSFTTTAISLADRINDRKQLSVRFGRYEPDDIDQFQFQLTIPRRSSDNFHKLDLLLEFGMVLKNYKNLKVTGLAHVNTELDFCSEVYLNGDFVLKQSYAFHGTDQIETYNTPIIDFTSIDSMDQLSIMNLLDSSFNREVTGKFVKESSFCKQGPNAASQITINLNIKIPVQTYSYEVEWFEKAKFAWMQYIAFLPLFWYFFYRVKRFMILRGLVNTRMQSPTKKLI
ncbi:hypothetical protein FDP41_008199 [Naegleria fowleri]|uniref:Transmembrane protein 231 n=1 Tax=Naegleria fowleri TaxID=5763 RepID=A0A6A5BIE4_NAEFO|nr:uncharacterized protein FDP41_008199 [Naegleria fowleri]KAF0973495.1 hypothetical protein FDP41_008199 [Naegleria fowleri]